jgi:hypothetical protein
LGFQQTQALWKKTLAEYDDTFFEEILASNWEPGGTNWDDSEKSITKIIQMKQNPDLYRWTRNAIQPIYSAFI